MVVIGRVVQVVIPVKEGLSVVPEIGKYSFLALIQRVESGKYQLTIRVMPGELFAEQALTHAFVAQVFGKQFCLETGVGRVEIIPHVQKFLLLPAVFFRVEASPETLNKFHLFRRKVGESGFNFLQCRDVGKEVFRVHEILVNIVKIAQ